MSSVDVEQVQPISRTYQYRKVMKPMLERKRRARINRCLDELKDFILSTLQAEGENVSKLEKADILEFTVQHLHKLRRAKRLTASGAGHSSESATGAWKGPGSATTPLNDADRFRAGFTQCASEVSRCLASTAGIDVNLGTKLMTHLGQKLNEMEKTCPLSVRVCDTYYSSAATSPCSTTSSSSASAEYPMPLTPNSSHSSAGSYSSRNSSPSHEPPYLLTVVDMTVPSSATKFNISSSSPVPVWRPW